MAAPPDEHCMRRISGQPSQARRASRRWRDREYPRGADVERRTELALRIVVQRPPAGVDYALQKGRGARYETVQTQRSIGKDLIFVFTIWVKHGRSPSFSGPFVQGAAGDKFVYIDIGRYAGQGNTDFARRLKVPLAGITPKLVTSGQVIEAVIPGTGNNGMPNCAYNWRKQAGAGWGWRSPDKLSL